jgi:hypothetical protein
LGGWLLLIATLGMYYLFWYYRVNRELRVYDPTINVRPGLAVLTQLIPIVGLVSIYNTGKRIEQAQTTAGVLDRASAGLGVAAAVCFAMVLPYYSSELNTIWVRRS